MKQTFVAQLEPGEVVDDHFLVRSVVARPGRRGSYLVLTLADRTGWIRAFADPPDGALAPGDVVRVTGCVRAREGELELLTWSLAPDPTWPDPTDLIPSAPEAPSAYLARLADLAAGIEVAAYRTLIRALLDDRAFLDAFCLAPGSLDRHHAHRGGLLQHTVEVMELAHRAAAAYPRLAADLDLLLVAGFFHDVGKADTYTLTYPFELTALGRTLGHEALGLRRLFRALDTVSSDPGGAVGRLVALLLAGARGRAVHDLCVADLAAVLSALDRMSAASEPGRSPVLIHRGTAR
jgi:3'-5' exoribonuclease